MVAVKRERNDTDEKMIRRFLKKVKKSSLMEELFKRRYYVKPSDLKRVKKKKQIAEYQKKMREENRK